MKTITQYKEDIKALMAKAADIDAQAVAENRDLTSAELGLKNEILDRVEDLTATVKTLERQERVSDTLNKPQPTAVPLEIKSNKIEIGTDSRSKDKFSSFGEQLMAIRNAGLPGGHADPRLFNAASGLNETTPSDGGFLVQQDFANDLLRDLMETGVLASKCSQIPISGNANSIRINGVDETSRASSRFGGVIVYHEEEAAEKTASKPKFRKIELSLKKLIGLCYATDELLDDAKALGAYMDTAFRSEMGFALDNAIINGSGAGQGLGILNSGCLVTISKEVGQAAQTIVTENIVKMYSRMFAPSRANGMWLINQDIEPQLFTMSLAVGTGGIPVYMPAGGLSGLPYATLFGRPVMAIEHCPTLGTLGDIIFADMSGMLLATKNGIKSDTSIHVRFVYDESAFRFVMRYDCQPWRAKALTPAKGSNTLSHFVALETRS